MQGVTSPLAFPFCRDVKPENIVVEGGRSGGKVYLVDFGSVQVGGDGGGYESSIRGSPGLVHGWHCAGLAANR